jgi:hypothetical protein
MNAMERIFFRDAKICVTNASVVVDGRVLPLDEAIAVEESIDDPARIGLFTLIIIGLLAGIILPMGPHGLASSAPFLLGGLFIAVTMLGSRKLYVVSLVRLKERIEVLHSDNRDMAFAVRDAIAAALTERHSAGA